MIPRPLQIGGKTFDWSRPVVMGIVNVTPDSFSDGGLFLDPSQAIAHGQRLVEEGADILDVGGESTRPKGKIYGAGAQTVPDAEEIERVVPVIRGLSKLGVPVSIDTRKASVAEAALDAGASMVNDVSGLLHDPSLAEVVRRRGVPLVLMHTPKDIEELSHESGSEDILGDVLRGLRGALERAAGVPPEQLVLDPGLGFGKSVANNLFLLHHIEAIRALGYPVLVGASRKSFLAKDVAPEQRLGASVAAAVIAFRGGANIIRAHDVRETMQALRIAAFI